MKKISVLFTGIAGLVLLAFASTALADQAKEVTITGEGKCGKCALKETAKCQNVIQVKKGDKTTTYYLVQNDVSKKFHEDLCKESKKVTATGTDKVVEGKHEFTATKIAAVEAK